MVTVAVRRPVAVGTKFTKKVVEPEAATGEAGCTVTLKSEAFAPLRTTFGVPVRLSGALPRLAMLPKRVLTKPKKRLAKLLMLPSRQLVARRSTKNFA